MASNEIEERAAFACWVRAGSAGGEGIHVLDPSTLTYRSRCSFQNRIITTVDAGVRPVIILPLDREFSRKETAVFGCRIGTVGPNNLVTSRASYPDLGTPPDDVAQIAIEPVHLDWFGPDLSSPTFMPFGLAPQSVPADFDLDLYNAIAVILPVVADAAQSGDFCIAGFEHIKPDVLDQPVQTILPAELPPPPDFPAPTAWWRMDDFDTADDESGLHITQYNPRSVGGLEGILLPDDGTLPTPDPLFNNQLVRTTNNPITSVVAAGFFDFMTSNQCTVFVVFAARDGDVQDIYNNGVAAEFSLETQPDSDIIEYDFGIAGAISTGFDAAAIDVAQIVRIVVDQAASPAQLFGTSTTGGPTSADFGTPPPDACTGQLAFINIPGSGVVTLAEFIAYDRTLTGPEQTLVLNYLTTRYGI